MCTSQLYPRHKLHSPLVVTYTILPYFGQIIRAVPTKSVFSYWHLDWQINWNFGFQQRCLVEINLFPHHSGWKSRPRCKICLRQCLSKSQSWNNFMCHKWQEHKKWFVFCTFLVLKILLTRYFNFVIFKLLFSKTKKILMLQLNLLKS